MLCRSHSKLHVFVATRRQSCLASALLCARVLPDLARVPDTCPTPGSPHIRHCRFSRRNFFFHGSSRGNPRWMEKLECLPAALMFSRKILLRLTRLCSCCSSSTAGVFASFSGNADDAQLAISAATSNVRLLCTNVYGFVPLADRITVGPLLSPFVKMCQVKRNLHPHHGGTLVCSSIDIMNMQRVIFRSLPTFSSFELRSSCLDHSELGIVFSDITTITFEASVAMCQLLPVEPST